MSKHQNIPLNGYLYAVCTEGNEVAHPGFVWGDLNQTEEGGIETRETATRIFLIPEKAC